MKPETLAKEIAQKVAASLEPALTAALAEVQKTWMKEAEKDLEQKMRDWMKSAPIAVSAMPFKLTPPEAKPSTDEAGRAVRGAVPKAIADVLAKHPGIKTLEVEDRAVALNPTISPKSVANELSRGKEDKYRRDDEGRWWLI